MTTLANTNWNLKFVATGGVPGSGPCPLSFGNSVSTSGFPGGLGTITMSGVPMNILWNEDGKGRFMFQMQGPTDGTNDELPTYTGQYESGTAMGWYTAFDATWAPQNFTMASA